VIKAWKVDQITNTFIAIPVKGGKSGDLDHQNPVKADH